MGHGVNDVVHANTEAECGVLFGVQRIIGVFPRIAEIHVVANGHHEPAVVVVDSAPAGVKTVKFIRSSRANELSAGHLITIVKIVNRVKDWIVVRNIDHRPIGKDFLHACDETCSIPKCRGSRRT